MMTLLKSVYFWTLTIVLLIIVGLSGLKIIPPMYSAYHENQQALLDKKTELQRQEKFLAAVRAVQQDESGLSELYDQAVTALPADTGSELLMLQLDGLLKKLSIDATINVPLDASKTATDSSATAQSSQNELQATITGEIDYPNARLLISRLKTFARWNKIKSFSIAKSGSTYNTNIAIRAFFKPGKTAEFSGDSNIMEQSRAIFDQLKSYSTIPDSSSEGTYGRPNPFSP